MPLITTIPAAILETVLTRLIPLFVAAADPAAARHAAVAMLAAYHPETPDELSLAGNIIAFSFQALEALAQAAEPDLPVTRVLRLRGGAVSLSREAAKAERSLTRLRKARQQAIPAQAAEIAPEPAQPAPKIDKTPTPIQPTGTGTVAASAKANGLTWTQAHEQRQRDLRIAASIKRAEAKVAAQPAPPRVPDQWPIAQAV